MTAENEINSMMHFNEELKMWFCGQCKMSLNNARLSLNI